MRYEKGVAVCPVPRCGFRFHQGVKEELRRHLDEKHPELVRG